MPDTPTPPRFPHGSPLWFFPLVFGAVIFGFGLLIWVMPELLAYIVGAAFCALGLAIMGLAWRLRPRTGAPRTGSAARSGSYVEFRVEE